MRNWSRTFRFWAFTVMVIALVGLIWYSRSLLSSLVIGGLLAYVLNPSVDYLERRVRLKRPLAVTLVMILGTGLLAVLPAIFIPRWVVEIRDVYSDLDSFLVRVNEFISQPLVLQGWELDLQEFLPEVPRLIPEGIARITENMFHVIESISRNLLLLLVVLATTYYLMRDWDALRDRLLGLVPEDDRADAWRVYQEIKLVWRGYLRGNLALMLIVGVVYTLTWYALGVPGALVLGVTAGVLTIIPDLGPAIAAGLAIIVALFEGSTYLPLPNFLFALLVTAAYLAIINVKNIWLRPRIFGRSVHMHEGVVFIAIIAAVIIQGILGAIVVIPVLGSAGLIGRYFWNRIRGLPAWPDESPASIENASEQDEKEAETVLA